MYKDISYCESSMVVAREGVLGYGVSCNFQQYVIVILIQKTGRCCTIEKTAKLYIHQMTWVSPTPKELQQNKTEKPRYISIYLHCQNAPTFHLKYGISVCKHKNITITFFKWKIH